jgi:hypothetical protein
MANLNGIYNPDAEAGTDFTPVPTGEYLMVITDSDMKPTNANTGEYLELTHEIIDGPYKARKAWARLNLVNSNAQAVEIANRDLASIRAATGVPNPRDSQELHNKPMLVRVEFIKAGTTKGKKTYDRDTNEIRAWKKAEGYVATNTAPSNAPAANNQAASSTPPWANKAA